MQKQFCPQTGTVPVSDLKLLMIRTRDSESTTFSGNGADRQTDRERETQTAAAERPADGRSLREPRTGPPLSFILSVTAANFGSSLSEVTFQSPHGIWSKRRSGAGTTCTAHQAAQVGQAVEKI